MQPTIVRNIVRAGEPGTDGLRAKLEQPGVRYVDKLE